MDSPEIDNYLMDFSRPLPSQVKVQGKEDSGYLTMTPSSAESSGIRCTSELHSFADSAYFSGHFNESLRKSLPRFSNTPDESSPRKRPRLHFPEPKHLVNDVFDRELSDSTQCSLAPLPVVVSFEHRNKAPLKRQNAISETMEWNPADQSAGMIITNVLKDLNVTDCENNQLLSKCSYAREDLSPINAPSSHYSLSSLPSNVQDFWAGSTSTETNEKRFVNHSSYRETITSKSLSSYPITPTKHRKKVRRPSPDTVERKSPPKTDDQCSPIFKPELYNLDRKSAKRLNFSTQKIGSPEKNKILYPHLKPVTPPKKIKSPEKIRESCQKGSRPKCRKVLQLGSTHFSWCGKRRIDFLSKLSQHTPVIKCLLSKLSGEDLENVCKVNRTWMFICQSNPDSEIRRKQSVQYREAIKENLTTAKQVVNVKQVVEQPHSVTRPHKDLTYILNHSNILPQKHQPAPRSPPVSPGRRQFHSFTKAASEDSASQLRSCPRCKRAARMRGQWAMCRGMDCGFTFCVHCQVERRFSEACCLRPLEAPSPSKQPPSSLRIGTKQSRKNLRRL